MNIVVCIKAVPVSAASFSVTQTGKWVEYKGGRLALNELDEYALDEAIAIKSSLGGQVIVLTAGSLMAQDVLYLGLAKGADRAVRIDISLRDPESLARVLAEAIRKIGYDLVLTGVESADNMASRVGISIAAGLSLPFAFAVTSVEAGGTPGIIRVTKEIGAGYKQLLEVACPALLCIQSGIQPLKYAPTRKLLEARKRPIESMSLEDLGLDENTLGDNRVRIVEVFRPKGGRRAEIIEGKPLEVAKAILKIAKEAC
ncbi:MAG: electron transfer flavoprotein subunit beta/FixA family protein [Chloroflexi bacterium]|nr:electron transfer flavoprotein subunit beta/FixA family protein [Chloroflexota bacterium]